MTGAPSRDEPSAPRIIAADVAPGHDGVAEVLVAVRHPNDAVRSISLPLDAVESALDRAGVTALADLVGRPWTVLASVLGAGATSQGAP